nr:hypothetical protein [Rhodococcus sp. 06-1059B-a]
MEAAAASLERGVRRVDDYWDGQAAQAFTEYSGRQIAAMYWEGSCGRTIHAISEAIAEEIREGVQTVVKKFAEMLEAEVDLGSGSAAMKVALEKVPVLGTAWQLGAIVDILRQTLDLTMDLVRRIEELVDQFGLFLDAIIDPEGQVSRTIDKYLLPFNDALDKGNTAVDAGKTADITPVLDAPDQQFSVGEGDQPWQDAV